MKIFWGLVKWAARWVFGLAGIIALIIATWMLTNLALGLWSGVTASLPSIVVSRIELFLIGCLLALALIVLIWQMILGGLAEIERLKEDDEK